MPVPTSVIELGAESTDSSAKLANSITFKSYLTVRVTLMVPPLVLSLKGKGVYKGWNSHPPSGGLHTEPVQSSAQNMYITPYIHGPNNYEYTKVVHVIYECIMNPL